MSLTPEKTPENENASETVSENVEREAAENTESTIFRKHTYDTKKPAKNGGKKRIAVCIIAAVLCAAVISGVFLAEKFLPDTDTSSINSVAEENSFLILKATDIIKESNITVDGESVTVDTNISKAHFINGYGEFTCIPSFEKKAADKASASSSTSSGTEYLYSTNWYVEGIDPSMTESSSIASKIKECLTVRAFREMENNFDSVEEYHKYYGMTDKLTAGLIVEFNDGTEQLMITVGTVLATGDAYYFKTSLSDTVYAVSSDYADYFFCSSKEFADGTMIEKIVKTDKNEKYFNSEGKLARYDKITLSGDVFDGKTYEFKMASGPSADYMPYLMTVPYVRPADDEFVSNILNFANNGLEATTLYSYSATDKEKTESGLDSPKCIIELTVGDYSFKITIGGNLGDGSDSMTAMVDGKGQIFGIDFDDLAFAINASNDITEMFNANFIREDIYTIKSVEISDSTGSYRFDLKHTQREADREVYDTEVKLNGTVTDTQSFKLIYQRVLMLSLVEYVTEAEHPDPTLTVKFNYIEGGSRTVELTPCDGDMYHYIAWVDGTPLGEVMKSGVDDIIKCLATYLAGGEVPDTW